MNINDVKTLVELFSDSTLSEFEFTKNDSTLRLKKELTAPIGTTLVPASLQPSNLPADSSNSSTESHTAPAVELPHVDESLVEILSPMVGTFYASSSPGAAPYVEKGQRVKTGDIVCIVEAMKLFNEIEAEQNGEIVEILAESGELVEFGQPLFRIRP
ncbi:acetyl-CoA carboxylase, biotin carboxyl carrier protein [Priestia megaterium]|nr:acetyl-CoA carboxylase, biotin carboxyl carrier protein [Priestia megaterium]